MTSKKMPAALLIVMLSFFMCTPSYAFILGEELFGFDFRFNNPGARSNAMGGAFIGLADDATAAFANPAGLAILNDPEISLEAKFSKPKTRVYDYYGDKDYENCINGISFISFAYPLQNATITIYRHQLIDLENKFIHNEDVDNINKTVYDYKILTTGLGIGFKITDTFSFGLSVGYAELDATSITKSYEDTEMIPPHDMQRETNDESTAQSYTASFLWSPFDNFNIGAVYRYGPEFTIVQSRKELDEGMGDGDNYEIKFQDASPFKIPDSYGLGLSYRFMPNFVAAIDVTRIEYSDLTDDLLADRGSINILVPINNFLVFDDVTEIHVGLEYVLDMNEKPLALRCGYYYSPDHHIYFKSPDEKMSFLTEKDDDDHIFSIGAGTVISQNIQVDASVSAGEFIKEAIMSFVYRVD